MKRIATWVVVAAVCAGCGSNNGNNGTNNGTAGSNNGTTAGSNNGTTAGSNNGTTAGTNNGTTAGTNNGTTAGTNNGTTTTDPCAGLENACDTEGATCSDDTLVTCAPNADGCLVETARNCGFVSQACENGACVDTCRDNVFCEAREDGETFCSGRNLITCAVTADGCLDISDTVDCNSTGQVCELGSAMCVDPVCGNSVIEFGETCDDGNQTPADGCDENCQIETVCGDSNIEGSETCDDGNQTPGDGCDENCQIEPFCGDGNLDIGEECDDAANADGDGCSATCTREFGYSCTSAGCVVSTNLGTLDAANPVNSAAQGPISTGETIYYVVTVGEAGVVDLATTGVGDFQCTIRSVDGREVVSANTGSCVLAAGLLPGDYEVQVDGVNANAANFDLDLGLDGVFATWNVGSAPNQLTGGPLAPGESTWAAVTFTENVLWGIALSGTGNGNPDVAVYTGNGDLIGESETAGADALDVPVVTGTYFIRITNSDTTQTVNGFTMTTALTTLSPSVGTLDGTTTLPTETVGPISAGEEAYVRFTVATAPVTANFMLSGNTTGEAGFRVYDALNRYASVFSVGPDSATGVVLPVGEYVFAIQADPAGDVDTLSVDISSD